MKIISKYHDYYDTVRAYGIDETITYIRTRKKENILISKNSFLSDVRDIVKSFRSSASYTDMKCHIIGFCGKIYPVLELIYDESDRNPNSKFKGLKMWAYSVDDFSKYLSKVDPDTFKAFIKNEKKFISKWRINTCSTKKELNDFFKKYHGIKQCDSIFSKYKVPSFLIELKNWPDRWSTEGDCELILNPILKNLEFYKVVDPFAAFQELSMFISGVIGVGEPNIVTISDKDKIKKKGFDKMSFRKRPTKRRKK